MFRFSIRELMLFTAVVGLGVSLGLSRWEARGLRYKTGLLEQVLKWHDLSLSYQGDELVLTSKEMRIRTTPEYIDFTTNDGGHGHILTSHPDVVEASNAPAATYLSNP